MRLRCAAVQGIRGQALAAWHVRALTLPLESVPQSGSLPEPRPQGSPKRAAAPGRPRPRLRWAGSVRHRHAPGGPAPGPALGGRARSCRRWRPGRAPRRDCRRRHASARRRAAADRRRRSASHRSSAASSGWGHRTTSAATRPRTSTSSGDVARRKSPARRQSARPRACARSPSTGLFFGCGAQPQQLQGFAVRGRGRGHVESHRLHAG